MVLLKYLTSFSGTLKMSLINCEISLQLKWFKNCILLAGTVANQNPTFQINDTKLYVSIITLSTRKNSLNN